MTQFTGNTLVHEHVVRLEFYFLFVASKDDKVPNLQCILGTFSKMNISLCLNLTKF